MNYKSSLCSCIVCHREFFSKSFHTHYQRIHLQSQSNYKNQTAYAIVASKEKAKIKKMIEIDFYKKNPKHCINCHDIIEFVKRNNKFCSRSCGTTYSNNRKDYTKIKPGPKKGTISPNKFPPYTKIKKCEICSRFHPGNRKTCSDQCKRKLLSNSVNRRIDAGWNPQENRCRSKPSYLEKSFQNWLIANNIEDFIKGKTFRCGGKIYYGDFFFPEKNLLIELDGKQHINNKEYDSNRDKLILQYHNVITIRISYSEYISKSKIDLIIKLLK